MNIDYMESTVLYHYLVEYLLVSKDIEKEMDKLTFDQAFKDILTLIINVDKGEAYFDSFMHNNLEKMFKYLISKDPSYQDIYELYKSYSHDLQGNFYSNQFYLKFDDLNEYSKNECFVWNVDDMRESVIFDFSAYATLLSCNMETYINDHFQTFAFNQKFLYFVSKLINQYPVVFKDKSLRLKIQAILMYNAMLDNPETEDSFKDYFVTKNINEKTEISDSEYRLKYQKFLDYNNKLLDMISNGKIYKDSCNIISYISAYNENIIEGAIYKDHQIPENPLLLDYLIKEIKELGNFEYTYEMKKHLLDLLATLRPVIGKDQIPIFNDCVSYINTKEVLERSNLNLYNENPNNVNGLLRVIIKVYKLIFDENDIGDKDAYQAINELFDAINDKKDFKDIKELKLTLQAFLKKYPNVITNYEVNQKITESLALLPSNDKKIITKKIKKTQKRKKV